MRIKKPMQCKAYSTGVADTKQFQFRDKSKEREKENIKHSLHSKDKVEAHLVNAIASTTAHGGHRRRRWTLMHDAVMSDVN